MIENDAVISDGKAVAETLNNYFVDVRENLDIEPFIETTDCEINVTEDYNAIEETVLKFKKHPSILKIKEHVTLTTDVYFPKPPREVLSDHLDSLDPKKATVENDIPTKILIDTKDIAIEYLSNIYHESIDNQIFPNILKIADVIPTHKQFEQTNITNYRPMYNQILIYMENHLTIFIWLP